MSNRYLGGFITSNPVQPTSTVAKGSWTLEQQMQAIAASNWPLAPLDDPDFNYVTMLLNGDGINGAQNNTFLDSSTNNLTITRNGNTTQGSFSPYGSNWSNYFDGSSSFINSTASAGFDFGTGSFTVEAFINVSAFITNSGQSQVDDWIVAAYDASANFPWILRIGDSNNAGNNKRLNIAYNGFVTQVISNTDLVAGVWTHVVVACNGSTISVFQNGTRVATSSFLGIATAAGAAKAFIGGTVNFSRYFNGYISNVRVVKGTDVYGASNTTITVPVAPLSAITNTQLLTCQSNRFVDNSTNNFAFTITSSPSVQRFSPFNPTAPYSTSTIGGSGYFDGSGDYLAVSSSASLAISTNDFCIETWFNTSSTSEQTFLSQWGGGANNWILQYRTGPNEIRLYYNSSNEIVGSFTLVLNQWNHIVVCRSGSTMSLYANGTRIATKTDSTNIDNTRGIDIGRNGDNIQYVTGYIEDCRLVVGSSVYTPSSSTLTVPTAPLTAITNTKVLANFTNAGIPDLAMINNLETVGNAQVSTAIKKYGTGSLAFDGTGDYLIASNNQAYAFNTGDFTMECWYYSGITTQQTLLDTRNTSNGPGVLMYTLNNLLQVYSGGGNASGSLNVPSNSWTHLVVERISGALYTYVNGVRDINGTSYTLNLTDNSFISGFDIRFGGAGVNGYLDDIRITKGLARYVGASFTPPTAALPTF